MQKVTTEYIDIRPGSDVYSTYRRIAYKEWYAVGEFVDNSTQNFFDHKAEIRASDGPDSALIIDIVHDSAAQTLQITDNAHGMELSELQRAIQLNRPPSDTSGRSEFGMGLKMAACWLGRRWRVVTKKLGSDTEYDAFVDVDMLEKNSPDSISVQARSGIEPSLHYTRIEIEDLLRGFGGRTIGRIKEHLASMYKRDISSGQVKILWKGEPLEWDLPPTFEEEYPGGEKIKWEKDISVTVGGFLVSGRAWIAIPQDIKRAGLHLYRRDRIIRGGPNAGYKPPEVFGTARSYRYGRLVGELNMDGWPVTQTKDDFDWVGNLEHELITKLREELAELMEKAESYRVHDQEDKPTKADVQIAADVSQEALGTPDFDIPLLLSEEGPPPEEKSPEEEKAHIDEVSKTAGKPTPITVGTRGLPTLNVYWADDLPSSEIYLEYASPTDDEVTLVVNLNHPFVSNVVGRDPARLSLWTEILFVDALVERAARRRGTEVAPSAFRKLRDQFLRHVKGNSGEVVGFTGDEARAK